MTTNNKWLVILSLALPFCVLSSRTLAQNSTASELLQKGIYLQETVGDLDGAIKVYKQVAHMVEESRSNAAQAEYRLGVCLQKKGQQEQALETFRKLTREYPEQTAIVTQARELLAKAEEIHIKDNPCQSKEDELKADPGNLALRNKVLGCYELAQHQPNIDTERYKAFEKIRVEHLLWFIQHAPDYEITGLSIFIIPDRDTENYVRLKHEWMRQVQAHSNNANVLVNAALFISLAEQDDAQKLVVQALAVDPKNTRAMLASADWHERKMRYGKPELKTQMAQRALQLREQALDAMTPEQKKGLSALMPLEKLATDAFESGDYTKAQRYAEELLQLASRGEKQWDPDIHRGNLILGRIALKNGNIEEAKNRLMAAGKMSRGFSYPGPNMTLAKELLEKGQQDVVLQYFDECSVFWKDGKDRLDGWRAAVRGGGIPDFGANLVN